GQGRSGKLPKGYPVGWDTILGDGCRDSARPAQLVPRFDRVHYARTVLRPELVRVGRRSARRPVEHAGSAPVDATRKILERDAEGEIVLWSRSEVGGHGREAESVTGLVLVLDPG